MPKYIKKNNYSSYIEIDQKRFLLHRISINLLKDVSFHLSDWNLFLQYLKDKKNTLLIIAKEIFSKIENIELEKIIWLLLEMATERYPLLVKEYLEYHAHLCFLKYWIHRYSYFEYHGFAMGKEDKGNYLRNKMDKGSKGLSTDIQKQVSNIMLYGKRDKSLPIRIVPSSKYHASININNSGWHDITVDAHSLHVQANTNKTQKLVLKIGEYLRRKGALSTVANQFKISASIVMMYAFAIHYNLMIASIKRSLRRQMLSNHHISLSETLQKHINQDSNFLVKLKSHAPEIYQALIKLTIKYQNLQVTHYKIFNKRVDSLRVKQYHLGYIVNKKWGSFKVDLSDISKDTVSRDIKRYALYRASNNKSFSSYVIDFFTFIKNNKKQFNIDATDILEEDFIIWLTYVEIKIELDNAKTKIASFYKYLVNIKTVDSERNVEKIKSIYKIISSDISIKNQVPYNATVPMPEDVYLQIKVHADELDTDIKNAFLIQSATGCRPSELASLHKDSLKYDKKLACYILSIYTSKQEAAYGKRGKLPIRKVPIYEQDIIQAFWEQVEISQEVRNESGNDSIFIRRYYRRHVVKYHIPSSKELIRDINILTEKYNIKSELDSETWHYTPYQMRAMIATIMVEKGHAPEEIRAFFGWLTNHTSEKAYAFIQKKKLTELNTKLYQKHFNITFDQESLKSYSREEKEQIFVKLYIHKRQVEYGECVRHPITGECGKIQNPKGCIDCARLNTDIPYLNNWIKIRDSQKIIYDNLVKVFESEGIPPLEYKTWSEYIKEKQRLDSYQGFIDNLSSKKDH